MQSNVGVDDGSREAPRSGAPAPAPFLDRGDGNVPGDTRPAWNRKQWKIRRAVLDRLRYWQMNEFECLRVTFTSAPSSPIKRLRKDFQVLWKRVRRELGYEGVQYVCVDTREGHGVLHMIWAWLRPRGHWQPSFYVEFKWLQDAWKEIHGAFHVHVKRIGGEDHDARRLSRYIVAQYCGGQNALVRLSQSKTDFPLSRARHSLLQAIRQLPERYDFLNLLSRSMDGADFDRGANHFLRIHFRQAWDELVRTRACEAYGVQFVWCDGVLMRV